MRAGKLQHRVTIEEAVTSQDSNGDPVVNWTPIATVWGAVEPIRGREAAFTGQTLAEMDTRILLRWSPITDQLTPKHRLTHQGAVFNVVSIANIRLEKREVEVIAKSGVNSG